MSEPSGRDLDAVALGFHRGNSVSATVELITNAALQAVGATGASVAFVRRGRLETESATDPRLSQLDGLAVDVGEGPAFEVRGGRNQVLVDDTRTESRWPLWATRMADAGIRSVLCVGMSTADVDFGMLTLYDPRPGAFGDDEAAVAAILARHAAVALGTAKRAENLWIAIDARKLIGQAQGILMERFDVTADQAFSVLLRYSQDKNIKLRDVAARLVAERRLPD